MGSKEKVQSSLQRCLLPPEDPGCLGLDLLLALEGPLLLDRLVPSVTELGRRVDELEVDLLERRARRVRDERLAERDDALDDTRARALQEETEARVSERARGGGRGAGGGERGERTLIMTQSFLTMP